MLVIVILMMMMAVGLDLYIGDSEDRDDFGGG
jgi:hypothetical protein